ncbi:MAG: hypothetical protein JXN59_09225 [Anaerolineae bacterium]|nr:hypothetical protein [Anaerolineae bacterium]
MLPALTAWQSTRTTLHQIIQVMGAVRREVASPQPNWVHLGLRPWEQGITTGPLPLGELILNAEDATLTYHDDTHTRIINLAEHTQSSLVTVVEDLLTEVGHRLALDKDKLTGEALLRYDRQQGRDYAVVLNFAWAQLAALRETLPDYQTEPVLWPHGFDAAFLWFLSEDQADEERDPHIGIGFSPGTADLERPYFYLYAWPLHKGLETPTLPLPARWHNAGWTGVVIDYDMVRARTDPGPFLGALLSRSFQVMQYSLDADT